MNLAGIVTTSAIITGGVALFAARAAREPVGGHRAAARQHVPDRRLGPDGGRLGAGGRHSLAVHVDRDQSERDRHHSQQPADQEPRDRARPQRRRAHPVSDATSSSSVSYDVAAVASHCRRCRWARARGDPQRRARPAASSSTAPGSTTERSTIRPVLASSISRTTCGPIPRCGSTSPRPSHGTGWKCRCPTASSSAKALQCRRAARARAGFPRGDARPDRPVCGADRHRAPCACARS